MEENGYNANSFSKKVDIDPGNLRKKLKGEYGITDNLVGCVLVELDTEGIFHIVE